MVTHSCGGLLHSGAHPSPFVSVCSPQRQSFGLHPTIPPTSPLYPYTVLAWRFAFLSAAFRVFSDRSHALHRFSHNLNHPGIDFVMWRTSILPHTALRCASAALGLACFVSLSITVGHCVVLALRPCLYLPRFRLLRALVVTAFFALPFLPTPSGMGITWVTQVAGSSCRNAVFHHPGVTRLWGPSDAHRTMNCG